MAILSFALLASALSTLAAAQVAPPAPLPAITGPGGAACGGCFVVADVAGIVFGNEILTQTNTQFVSVGTSPNGTNVTTITSIQQNSDLFTFGESGLVPGGAAPTSFNPFSSVITVGGAVLTSPTSYEVFSAYSVTSTIPGPNGCQTIQGTAILLPQAFSVAIPANAGQDFLLNAESSFIASIGLPHCSAGGGIVQSTVHSMVTSVTVNSTTVGPLRPTPMAVSTIASATAMTTASASAGSSAVSGGPSATGFSNSSATPFLSVAAGTTVIVYPNATGPAGATFTIVPFLGAASSIAPTWAAWAAGAVCAAMAAQWI